MIQLQEVPLPANFNQGGFAVLYIPDRQTVYITGDAMHSKLGQAVELDPHHPYYFGDIDGMKDGINWYEGEYYVPDVKERFELTPLLEPYIGTDNSHLNKPRERARPRFAQGNHIQQIFDAQPESDYIKGLYFADEDTLYWWFVDSLDGYPIHAIALQSWGMTFEEMTQRGSIVPILGGDIYSDANPPEPVTWRGDQAAQKRAADLVQDLIEELRSNRFPRRMYESKVSSKIVEVETEHGFGGWGGEIRRPVVYVPDQDTMYVGNFDGSHAGIIDAIDKRFRKEYPAGHGYTGDNRWEDYGYWEFYSDEGEFWVQPLTEPYPTENQKEELIDVLGMQRQANIYDPIEDELDHHAFKNGKPRQSVVNFIKRLYGRALKQEYGIENAELFIDLYITGSLTTFQYSETSDCDVSVFPNYERFAQSFDEDASKTRKRLVALSIEHIDGTFLPGTTHPLQFFVVADGIKREDLYAPGLRSAWSVFDKMWVVPPERERSHEVAAEFPDAYSRASSIADKMKDALDHDPDSARELWKQVHMKRQLDQRAGLGDYSEGNIVYKWLLHEGLFDRIKNELHEYIAKRTMAERTGDSELDALIEEFERHIEPSELWLACEAEGECDDVSQEFVRWLMERGIKAETTTMENENPGDYDANGYADVPENVRTWHTVVWVERPTGTFIIDWTAAQYGYQEYPMIQRLDNSGWQREWISSLKEAGTTLFHATDVSPDQIQSHGIDWQQGRWTEHENYTEHGLPTGNYFWETFDQADRWAQRINAKYIYAVDVNGLHLIADPYFNNLPEEDDDWQAHMAPHGGPGAFVSFDAVPPDKIKAIYESPNPMMPQDVTPWERVADRTWILRVVDPSTVNYDATSSRGDLGYPVIADRNTHQAFIGPLGSHHADVLRALYGDRYITDIDLQAGLTSINLWPPGTYRSGYNDWYIGWYESEKEDGELSNQLADWVKQQDNMWNKRATVEPTDENEIRWGYNKATGEVIVVRAWGSAWGPNDIVTHMDMAAKWVNDGKSISYDDMEQSYKDLFFGYAYWDEEANDILDFQVYSLDMTSDDWELTPEDIKHIQDKIRADAPVVLEA